MEGTDLVLILATSSQWTPFGLKVTQTKKIGSKSNENVTEALSGHLVQDAKHFGIDVQIVLIL